MDLPLTTLFTFRCFAMSRTMEAGLGCVHGPVHHAACLGDVGFQLNQQFGKVGQGAQADVAGFFLARLFIQ